MGGGYNPNICCLQETRFIFIYLFIEFIYLLTYFNLHLRIWFLLLLKREEQIERDICISILQKNIDCLPSVCAQTRD